MALHVSEQRQLSRFCSVSIECSAGAALIRLDGELDLTCEDGLCTEVAHIRASRPSSVIVDLGDVTFIDSPGLGMLVELDAAARQDGFELGLARADGQVRSSMRITGLDRLLPLVEPLAGREGDSRR